MRTAYGWTNRIWNEALEEAARLCESNDEVVDQDTGKRRVQAKTSNNVNGNAYAEAIRALKRDAKRHPGVKPLE